ncbi:fimbrial assembly protein [Cellulomonas humilata]|uniref:Tfp pilus assembly protein PilN n=1 Tax=Cellulomonas humilata TaxID=144055 RepID=A0ABU0EF59_9CELL|nr:fimbrial assembly protein [Cellulomonas humilata]MDQ0373904.1 Tfp pilus assembly protein PilN [Cellulomonas humilata]
MTSLLERPAKSAAKGAVTNPNALPQVNLLPPGIRARRALGRTKTRLGIALVLVLVLVVAVAAGALAQLTLAKSRLSDAQSESAQLTQQQAKYAEVPQVIGQLDQANAARELGFSTDTLWTPYLMATFAVLPAGAKITSIEMVSATPMQAAEIPVDPLQAPSVGRLAFVVNSPTLPDTAAWLDGLNSIPGFSDAWMSTTALAEDENKNVFYQTSVTVQVTEAAYSGRFSPEGE